MTEEDLGLDLKPGDEHYRAYVGPPQDYDLISAMTFNLLTTLGLRQHHKLLDIGCGSLRLGRLFIPYLNSGNYTGVEPNGWLIDGGIKNEIGNDLINLKKPNLLVGDSISDLDLEMKFDFAFAQSIYSHCGMDLIDKWLEEVGSHSHEGSAFLATFVRGEKDFEGNGWVYPGCVEFTDETMILAGKRHGFNGKILNWWHPRQTWCLYYMDDFDVSWISEKPLCWNDFHTSGEENRTAISSCLKSLVAKMIGK